MKLQLTTLCLAGATVLTAPTGPATLVSAGGGDFDVVPLFGRSPWAQLTSATGAAPSTASIT
jgi:hypothetical protein